MTTFKVRLFGATDATATCVSFDDALTLLMPAIGNVDTSGDIVSLETGEVLVLVQEGQVTYIAEETVEQIFCEMVEADPDFALFLGMMAMVAEAFGDESAPTSVEAKFTTMSLLDILGEL